MTEAEMDRMMRMVLLDAIALNEKDANDPETAFQSSRHHSRQMQRMLKDPLHWARNRNKGALLKTARWVAVILLFVALSFGMAMLFSAPVRAAVERWVVEWYQTHIIYRYSGKAVGLPSYELTGLSEGFSEIERMEEQTFTSVIYGNETDERICFDYEVLTQGGANAIVLNEDVVVEVTIKNNHGKLCIPQDPESMKTLIWIDEKDSVQFTIIADLNVSDLIELAESLQKKKGK